MLTDLRRLWQHVIWADTTLLGALEGAGVPPADAVREYAHILGADEVWLARLEGRTASLPVWPTLEVSELQRHAAAIHAGFDRYLTELDEAGSRQVVDYVNTAGKAFRNPVQDILIHVVLHAQYHRGKVNQLLRQAGLNPAPVDFIAFVRGAPAATTRVV